MYNGEGCPEPGTIKRKAQGLLGEAERQTVALHITICPDCKETEVFELAGIAADAAMAGRKVLPPMLHGR